MVDIQRNYPKIQYFLNNNRSILVLGPRGTGKTYYLRRLLKKLKNCEVIDLLNKESYRRYLTSPSLLYQEAEFKLKRKNTPLPLFVMIDEVQLIPELLDEVQRAIEAFKPNLVFVLTGSSARKLKRVDSNLLAGRALKIDFFPLGIDEIDFSGQLDFVLQWGSLPEAWTTSDEEIRRSYLNTYVGTYLDEEIKKESQLRNLSGFTRFLELAAADNGQCINYSNISRSAGIADVTVKDYYTILTDTLLAYHVPAWSNSKREQLQLAPKFYLFDNGIINALLGELMSVPRPSTYRYGRLFENMVLGQLMQYRGKKEIPVSVFHYRNQSSVEIDFILQKNPNSPPVALEIKSVASPAISDVRQLVDFKAKYPGGRAAVICRTPKSYIIEDIEFLSLNDGISKVFELAVG